MLRAFHPIAITAVNQPPTRDGTLSDLQGAIWGTIVVLAVLLGMSFLGRASDTQHAARSERHVSDSAAEIKKYNRTDVDTNPRERHKQ